MGGGGRAFCYLAPLALGWLFFFKANFWEKVKLCQPKNIHSPTSFDGFFFQPGQKCKKNAKLKKYSSKKGFAL